MKDISKIFNAKFRKGLFKSEKTKVTALENISLSIKRGEIFSLLGPNGAGKTTAIKILTTLLLPTSGEATVNSFDIYKQPEKIRSSINAMLMGERSIYWKLSGRQNLQFFGSLYYQSDKQISERISNLSELLELQEFLDRPVESFSSGQKYKIAFAKTLINDPPIIFLDEPTATLDPRAARTMRSVIKKVNKEEQKTIFLTTHNMLEATELSDRVAIIDLGKIIAVDTPNNLRFELGKTQHNSITLTFNALPDNLINNIKSIEGVLGVSSIADNDDSMPWVRILTDDNKILYQILELFKSLNLRIFDIKTETPSLEDVFLEKTGRTLAENTAVKTGGS
jgi:ABC-2 type transport system ATP-binding protein